MRITRNDITTKNYTATQAIDAEGMVTKAWAFRADVRADWQPIDGKTALDFFGVNGTPADTWKVFCDSEADYPINSVALKGGKTYQCQSLRPWYSHAEAIMVPLEVTLP